VRYYYFLAACRAIQPLQRLPGSDAAADPGPVVTWDFETGYQLTLDRIGDSTEDARIIHTDFSCRGYGCLVVLGEKDPVWPTWRVRLR
jgi:hypothetical protein